ncbi:MAG: transglycosylase domain-containing protein [Bacteroidales bacterium]|jgi:penicillin-binding protein 1A|nr:transglycosylase domain-containing protein [Bacteroidales bacterium]MDD2263499.1 transglycosylase domain-containing protein [Bacteroidales bacterium]MDD2830711.1 transglycosylase domain-containing protein [Bacteroidales bacterium]MDD3207910.1 transglycosylase domain-containing protein [Bacteroidales bacterium]MDD3696583.1 transglycosylase domain-containing protein [Bacteroidales bacterium]
MKEKTKTIFCKWLWIIVLIPVAGLILMLFLVGAFTNIPSFRVLENPKNNLATELISEDGVVIATFHVENRSYVQYEDLSKSLINAVLATEDIRFYRHSGIDFRALARVAVKSILLGQSSSGGGSTLSQQVAKTLYPRDTTVHRFPGGAAVKMLVIKMKEWITAVKLERNYTKEELLTMYLNSVFYGSNAYGIRTAASTFFDKHPSQLTIEEAATLVGIVNKPTRYNPVLNYASSLRRRNHVISQMSKYKFIDRQEADSLMSLPIMLNYTTQDHNAGLAPYFRDMLRRVMSAKEPERKNYTYEEHYLEDLDLWENDPLYGWLNKNLKPDGSAYDLDRDGLKIYTTINARMQLYANQAIEEHLGTYLQPTFNRELRYKRNKPFSNDVPAEVLDLVMRQAIRWSDRYRNMKSDGAGDQEIDKAFRTKTSMRVFSWNGKDGTYATDTMLTPRDSILHYKSFLRGAIMAMEPGTGHIKAYVGGPNYRYFKYDNASQGRRQVGSTIKPFLYSLAMQEGWTPCDVVVNVPQTFIVGDTTWTPESVDKPEWIGKKVTLKWGLTKSSNNISAYLMKQFGPEAMVTMCHKLGIKSHLDPVVSLCLGPADLRLYEMVAAYNTFANKGVYVEPFLVTRIEDNSGNLLGSFSPRKREAIGEHTAYLMVNLLQGVVNEGTAIRIRALYLPRGTVAGKTGTTNDQADGWFMGITPRLTAGVWVGAEDRQVHFESLALGGGSNMALPIWGIFMKKVMNDPSLGFSEEDQFTAPPGFDISLNCDGSDQDIDQQQRRINNFFN